MSKNSFISAIIQVTIVAGALYFALTYGNDIEPSDLSTKLSENVIIFNEGYTSEPLLPQLPME